MGEVGGLWWLPGALVGATGVLALVAGFATGGPDAVGGVVFGSVALAAAGVIAWRRAPRRGGPGAGGKAVPGPPPRNEG